MARILLPATVATTALLLGSGLAMTTYTAPIEGASSDPALYNLIASALHAPEHTPGPHPGQSPLSIVRLPSPPDSLGDSGPAHAPLPGASGSAVPSTWAATAAKADAKALRDWLGRWVVATSITTGDTVRTTLRRFSLRPGCPLISTLIAKTAGVLDGTYRLVDVEATCPRL